jgi:peptide/nickel transport system substrate-binding protein
VDAYLRVGIQVELRPVAPKGDLSYFDQISDPANPYHMVYAGWIADWANGSAVIPPLFDGAVVPRNGEYGGSNYSHLQSPEIDKMIDDAMAENNLTRQYRMWGEIDSKLQEMAVTVPVLYQNAIRLMGSNVTGAFIHSQFGMPDLCALGLLDAAASEAS